MAATTQYEDVTGLHPIDVAQRPAGRRGTAVAIALCLLVMMAEGYDLVVMGLAGPRMMAEFSLTRSAFGLAASIMMSGFLIGSMLGGRFGDQLGRHRLLAAALVLVGIFSLSTPFATSVAVLAAIAFGTGLGMGAVLPNVLALAGANAPDRYRALAVAVVASGGSVGAIGAGGVAALGGEDLHWHILFFIGGTTPLLLAPMVLVGLGRRREQKGARAPLPLPIRTLLFGHGRCGVTVALWAASFFTMTALYVVLSWLPTILAERGLSPTHTGVVNMLVSAAGVIGSAVFAWPLDRGWLSSSFAVIYGGLIAALALMASASSFDITIVAALALGLFLYGATTALYSLAILLYPAAAAAAGVGWSIGIGRIGAILGPVAAGVAMDKGASGTVILAGVIPMMAISGLALAILLRGHRTIGKQRHPDDVTLAPADEPFVT